MRCHLEARQQGLHIRMRELSPIDGGNLNTKAVASLSNQHVRKRAMAGLPRLREITWQQLVDVNEAFQKACPYAHYSNNSIILLGFVCTECGSFPKQGDPIWTQTCYNPYIFLGPQNGAPDDVGKPPCVRSSTAFCGAARCCGKAWAGWTKDKSGR